MNILLLIPSAARDAVNALEKRKYDPTGGDSTFVRGISPTGMAPITHYVASFSTEDMRIVASLKDDASKIPGAELHAWDDGKEPTFVNVLFDLLKLKYVQAALSPLPKR